MKDEIDVQKQLKIQQQIDFKNATDLQMQLNKAEYKLKEREFRKECLQEEEETAKNIAQSPTSIFQKSNRRRVASATPRPNIRKLMQL